MSGSVAQLYERALPNCRRRLAIRSSSTDYCCFAWKATVRPDLTTARQCRLPECETGYSCPRSSGLTVRTPSRIDAHLDSAAAAVPRPVEPGKVSLAGEAARALSVRGEKGAHV